MTLTDFPDVLSIKDLAACLPISERAVYEAIQAGHIPSFRIGHRIFVRKANLPAGMLEPGEIESPGIPRDVLVSRLESMQRDIEYLLEVLV